VPVPPGEEPAALAERAVGVPTAWPGLLLQQPEANGGTLNAVGSLQCGNAARAAARLVPTTGWAAPAAADRAAATPFDSHQPVLLLLTSTTVPICEVSATARRLAQAWEDWACRLAAAGLPLGPALLVADTFAGVAAQLTLLPLAGEGGWPHLALYGAELVLAAGKRDKVAAAALAALGGQQQQQQPSPAACWNWLARHAAAHASGCAHALAGMPPFAPDWVQALARGAAQVQLAPGVGLPAVVSGGQEGARVEQN